MWQKNRTLPSAFICLSKPLCSGMKPNLIRMTLCTMHHETSDFGPNRCTSLKSEKLYNNFDYPLVNIGSNWFAFWLSDKYTPQLLNPKRLKMDRCSIETLILRSYLLRICPLLDPDKNHGWSALDRTTCRYSRWPRNAYVYDWHCTIDHVT